MAVSDSVAAGIRVAFTAFTFIVSFPIVLWLRRWFLRGLPPDPPSPYAHENKLLKFGNLIIDAVEPEYADELRWPAAEETLAFAAAVDKFVLWFVRGDGTQGDVPYDSEKFHRLAGGPHEDWDNLLEFDSHRRHNAIVHFICRVLCSRMIPGGDCSITILPADMLATYQRILTKLPPDRRPTPEIEERKRSIMMLRQYWRALTVFCISENYSKLLRAEESGSRKPNAVAIRWWLDDTFRCKMWEDDPRLPNILAVEALLKDALEPFWDGGRQRQPDKERRFECAEAKELLREVTTIGADIALRAFSQIEPTEFYWPSTNRREGPDPFGDGGYLHCFGVRQRKPSPGSEAAQYNQVVTTVRPIGPIYNDTGNLLHHMFRGGVMSYGKDARDARERRDANNGEETDDERKYREFLEDRYNKLMEYWQHYNGISHSNPGWDGATNFF